MLNIQYLIFFKSMKDLFAYNKIYIYIEQTEIFTKLSYLKYNFLLRIISIILITIFDE